MTDGSAGSRPDLSGMPLIQSVRFLRDSDASWCRQQVTRFASDIGFSGRQLWEIAIAVSELVSNAVKFAGGGTLRIRVVTEPRTGVEITVEDQGPGIQDIPSALLDGYSEGRMLGDEDLISIPRRGLGAGLGAVQRMTDSLCIENVDGGGLRAVAVKWLPDSSH